MVQKCPGLRPAGLGALLFLVYTSRWTPSPGPGEHASVPASGRDLQRGSPTGKEPCAGLNSMKQGLCFICHCVPSGPAQGLAQTRNSVNTGGVRGVGRKEGTPPFPPPDCPKPSKAWAADQQCCVTWTLVENADSQPRLRVRICILTGPQVAGVRDLTTGSATLMGPQPVKVHNAPWALVDARETLRVVPSSEVSVWAQLQSG